MDTISTTTLSNQPWEGRAFLLVDLDAFFASVEQLDHPEWRGKPVIVGGDADKRGVVSTASYEAREFGVHSAMPSATAKKLCPDAIWVHSHFDRYHEMSKQVMDILYGESPLLQQVSIDEAFLDVTPGRFTGDSPVDIATRIQNKVSELGVTCSIGIANSMTVAKIASDLDKPHGLTVVYPGSEEAFLSNMNVKALPGIGKRSAERLERLGIRTLGTLAYAKREDIAPIFGANAQIVQLKARGIDAQEVITERETKSIGHERTFTQDLLARKELEDAIDYIAPMVGRRMRRKGFAGRTVTLKLRYSDLSRRTAQHTFAQKTNDEHVFIPIAKSLIDEIWRPGDRIRLVGISLSGFDDADEQLGLFADQESSAERPELISAADKVRDKFGDHMLKFGRELKIKKQTGNTTGMNDGEL